MKEDIKASAENYFNNGLMCAESVVLALTQVHGIESELLPKAATVIRKFEEEFGTRNCHELLGGDLSTPDGQATFRNEGLRKRCNNYTGRAAELAEEILAERAK